MRYIPVPIADQDGATMFILDSANTEHHSKTYYNQYETLIGHAERETIHIHTQQGLGTTSIPHGVQQVLESAGVQQILESARVQQVLESACVQQVLESAGVQQVPESVCIQHCFENTFNAENIDQESFEQHLFQFSKFICGGENMHAIGFLAETASDNKENGFNSFIRLIGSLYFKKNASEFLPEFTSSNDIFKSLCQNHTMLSTRQLHEKWLDRISDKVQVRASYEDEIPPNLTTLHYHWLRSCLVSQMYDQASDNTIVLSTYSEYGFEVRKCDTTVVPIWDDKL
ncbi:unnamed protein product [Mytilus coruscus]|uniref:Uncharacterized protein n=1 Tax=Mytilus coruscus TaxID=42192 RepID=A0A6J8A1T0_MYTCO|nr:unnamed protein product [Mytilus coruscus]